MSKRYLEDLSYNAKASMSGEPNKESTMLRDTGSNHFLLPIKFPIAHVPL